MSTRAFRAFFAVFPLLLGRSAHAQSAFAPDAPAADIDEFDLGDEWVDSGSEGGWYAPWNPLVDAEQGGFRLDISGGIGLGTERAAAQDDSLPASPPAQVGARQEYYALATLQIPFDRLFGGGAGYPETERRGGEATLLLAQGGGGGDEGKSLEKRKSSDAPESKSGAVSSLPITSDEGQAATEERVAHETREVSAEDNGGARTLGEYELERMFTPELSLLLVREIADRVTAALGGAEGRIRSLIRRSRLSGLSPELRLRGVLGFDRATSTEESVGIYPGDTTVRGGRDSLAEARLTFRLDRLVLGDGEPSLERQRIDLAAERRKLIQEALELLFDWRLRSSRASDISLPEGERIEAAIEAESALSELHLLTGGWFQGIPTVRRLSRDIPNSGPNREQSAPPR